jgi:hypothetical protein
MKRILTVLALAAALVCFSACKGGNKVTKLSGPEEVAKVALESMKKGDVKAFVDTFNLSDDDKAMLTSLIDEKLKEKIEEKGGIKSYEIGESSIDGDKATVKAKVYYKDGSEEDEDFHLTKVDGKWLQEMSK